MNSINQKAKADRRAKILKAIEGKVIPEYGYGRDHPIPQRVKEIIYDLKISGVFAFCTNERDIWRSLYKTSQETTGRAGR